MRQQLQILQVQVLEDVLNFIIAAPSVAGLDLLRIPLEWRSRMCAFLEDLGLFQVALWRC
jgi:hypothetical protein